MRGFFLGAAAILLFTLMAMLAIYFLVPDAPSLAALSADATPAPAPADAGMPQSLPSLSLVRPPDPPPPPLIAGPPPPRPQEGSWEAVPPVARASEAGPVGAALGRELNELQPRLSNCFDEDVQARHGLEGVTRTSDYAPLEEQGATILMLQVETRPGEIRIVEAPVETRGGASDGLLACAQRVLRGHTLKTHEARAVGRYRILYSLLR